MMKHIPNLLTFIRLLLIPLYFTIFYSGQPHALRNAMLVFVIASLTDVLDGYLARKYEVESQFGTIADPFADKLMQLSVIYSLADTQYLDMWFFWLILIKEFIQVLLGAILAATKVNLIIPANIFGKATTVVIFLTIILSIFNFDYIRQLQLLVAILAIFTFAQYAVHGLKAVKNYRQNNRM